MKTLTALALIASFAFVVGCSVEADETTPTAPTKTLPQKSADMNPAANDTSDVVTDQIVLEVDGMMCVNCEKHVCEMLKGLDGVVAAKADHKTGNVVVTFDKSKPFDVAKATDELDRDNYTVTGSHEPAVN